VKTLYVAGSRRFIKEITISINALQEAYVVTTTVLTPNLSEKEAIQDAYFKIQQADFIYIVAVDGYAGKTVALEIGYAYALGKPIISSEKITDESIQPSISKVLSPQELLYNHS
jgi:nucleoside 2-deoxyribosyltransferase